MITEHKEVKRRTKQTTKKPKINQRAGLDVQDNFASAKNTVLLIDLQ